MALNNVGRSPLGAFIRSPLGARTVSRCVWCDPISYEVTISGYPDQAMVGTWVQGGGSTSLAGMNWQMLNGVWTLTRIGAGGGTTCNYRYIWHTGVYEDFFGVPYEYLVIFGLGQSNFVSPYRWIFGVTISNGAKQASGEGFDWQSSVLNTSIVGATFTSIGGGGASGTSFGVTDKECA